jgi:hypothetical protein
MDLNQKFLKNLDGEGIFFISVFNYIIFFESKLFQILKSMEECFFKNDAIENQNEK